MLFLTKRPLNDRFEQIQSKPNSRALSALPGPLEHPFSERNSLVDLLGCVCGVDQGRGCRGEDLLV